MRGVSSDNRPQRRPSPGKASPLARGRSAPDLPAIRGSEGQTLPQWLTTVDRDVAEYWQTAFNRAGYTYTAPGEVIFNRPVGTRCGPEEPNRSSFDCPTTVYLDLPYEAGLLKHFVGDAAVAISVAHERPPHSKSPWNYQE